LSGRPTEDEEKKRGEKRLFRGKKRAVEVPPADERKEGGGGRSRIKSRTEAVKKREVASA